MELLISMFPSICLVASPIIICALGGIFSERCGIINIALEGMMLVGAFAGATVCYFVEGIDGISSYAPVFSIIAGMIAGGLFSLLLSVATINFKADHTIAGTALNLLSLGLTVYLCQIIFKMQRTETFTKGISKIKEIPILSDIPVIGKMFVNIYPTIFLAVILVFVVQFVLFKTVFGLRLRSCGENPGASASMGIDVFKTRYIGVLISGSLAGIAGAAIVLTESTQFTISAVHGIGFISIAAVIFGKWKPFGVLGAGMFFGLSSAIGVYANGIPLLNLLPGEFFSVIPYVLTIVALILFSGKSIGPKAAGQIYDAGKR